MYKSNRSMSIMRICKMELIATCSHYKRIRMAYTDEGQFEKYIYIYCLDLS